MVLKLKIYLTDLTYDTVTLSTETMPLNVGYIASYCIKRFGIDVDVTLFKYIEKLDKAIQESPPDILGIGNYCWSKNVGLELFRMLRIKNPNALTVMGGPNFPIDIPSQEKFLERHPEIDIYVPYDGEIGFSNIVSVALNVDKKENLREILLKPIDNCITRNTNGKLNFPITDNRIKKLDEIPSPYASGLLDEFFDGRLSPMLQTNRGCPFTCTFCTDGVDAVNQVNQFSLERVRSDINYIATHVPKNIHSLVITDLNFGMYPRDLEICDYLVETQEKYGYPQRVVATTGKNKKDRIIEAVKRLNGTMSLLMSVQSLDSEVLKNIRRSNISVEQMMGLAPAIREANLRTTSEIILALPGETHQSHISSLKKLVDARIDDIVVHTCMMLDGAEMNTPAERRKWDFKTKFRILPRDFARLSNGKTVLETEEVVVASNTLTFDEYLELRLLAFSIFVTNRGIVYDALLKFLREYNINIFELFYRTVTKLEYAPENVRNIFSKYKNATIDELWDSPEEIIEFYQKEENYKKLLAEEAGINVMHHHHAVVTSDHMEDWTEYVLSIAYELMKENEPKNEDWQHQFNDVGNYCRGISYNVLGTDRMKTNPQYRFQYNISRWLLDNDDLPLRCFKLNSKLTLVFKLSKEQDKLIQDNLGIYGNTPNGKGQVLKKIPKQMLWRQPVATKNSKVLQQRIDKTGTWSNIDDGTFGVPSSTVRFDEVPEFDQ